MGVGLWSYQSDGWTSRLRWRPLRGGLVPRAPRGRPSLGPATKAHVACPTYTWVHARRGSEMEQVLKANISGCFLVLPSLKGLNVIYSTFVEWVHHELPPDGLRRDEKGNPETFIAHGMQ